MWKYKQVIYYKTRFFLLYLYCVATIFGGAEKIRIISTERPRITYNNPKYVPYANVTSKRLSRSDPKYYLDLHFSTTIPINNTVSVHMYFYEFLSNRYRRGFVEMHYKFCDLVHKDSVFGRAMRQGKLAQPCPYPPGLFSLYNMSIPTAEIPTTFPFTKGRIICNVTSRDNTVLFGSGHIDMEIKTINLKREKH